VGINKNILRSHIIRLFAGAPEEILQHPRVTFHSPVRTRSLLFLGQKCIEGSLPTGSSVRVKLTIVFSFISILHHIREELKYFGIIFVLINQLLDLGLGAIAGFNVSGIRFRVDWVVVRDN
jgi:hypothetical protein